MSGDDFRELLDRLARAWSTQDTELGLAWHSGNHP